MFYFTSSVHDSLTSSPMDFGTFQEISTVHQFWEWFDGPLMDVLNSTSNNLNINVSNSYYTSGHHLIGSALLRQLRVKRDKCKVPGQFGDNISGCITKDFIEDRDTFGTTFSPSKYYWSQPTGVPFYGIFGQKYHDGGFKQFFTGNRDSAAELSKTLQVTHFYFLVTPRMIHGCHPQLVFC
jgi:hypothetical protein